MACRFGSPDLVTSLAGTIASPTFAFDAANSNYLGLAGSFTSNNGVACSFPTRYIAQQRTSTYAITPVIVTAGRTTTCSILAPPSITPSASGSTTYSGFECPSITDNRFSPGTYTLRFNQPNVPGVPTISSRTFIVGAPTFSTDRTTTTVISTATPPSITEQVTTYIATITTTLTIPGPTADEQTFTQTITSGSTATTVVTDVVSSCIASSTSSSVTSTPTASLPVSGNGQCGSRSGQTCAGSTFGSCCSSYGFCGSTDIYCLTTEGCQSEYGSCNTPSPVSSSSPPSPTSTVKVSVDGTCGGENGYVCPGSGLGDCCSPYGWCGSSDLHCGAGCQNVFGLCSGSTPTGTAPQPTSTLKVSLNGACGGTTGQTCSGSTFGSCCSEYGYCGDSAIYCTGACQPTFGTCGTIPAKRSVPKNNLRAASFPAVKQPANQMNQRKRAIGGAGPDYTYPPIPRTTVTSTTTQTITLVPTQRPIISSLTTITITTILPADGSTVTTTTTIALPITTATIRTTQTICPSSV